MSNTLGTIDMTPTYEEATRIYAYVLCTNAFSAMVLEDYWEPTEDEGQRIRAAWTTYQKFLDTAKEAGLTLSVADKRKWAKACLKAQGFKC